MHFQVVNVYGFGNCTSQTKAYGFRLVNASDERIGQMLAGECD